MQLSDFDFDLPEALIATRPARPRSSARLLVSNAGVIQDLRVADLIDQFGPGDVLVLNNTKVIPARLFGQRHRGEATAKVEVTLLEPTPKGWRALAKPLRKLALGETIVFDAALSAEVIDKSETDLVLAFNLTGDDFDAALNRAGAMPLPPYIAGKRPADEADKTDYQTVFARHMGAVAAPTASLHFDAEMLSALQAKGVQFAEVTLHVGAGTFLPVKVDEVTPAVADQLNTARAAGHRIIPVGTTALRLIETAARSGRVEPWQGPTDIFIYPGFQFQITSALMTNFHLPKSTLLMLVSALIGKEQVDRIYAHAVATKYRFFSYGDASLLIP
jgi:S-adenosylmethionine:tRNA ribosyltransferase-isomerase